MKLDRKVVGFLMMVLIVDLFLFISYIGVFSDKAFPITTDTSTQRYPAIYEDIVVWTDTRNGNSDIYGYDLSTKEEFQITTNPEGQYFPAIYGDIVVWIDKRNGNKDIYGYNLSTEEEFQITSDTGDQWIPAIYDNIVVWEDYRNGYWDSEKEEYVNGDIYGYDLITSTEFPIVTDTSNQRYPAIYGHIVVWQDGRNDSCFPRIHNCDIYGYDLFTNQEFQITTNEDWQGNPAIYGDIVIWQDFRNSTDIYGYDLSTSEEFRITSDESWPHFPEIYSNFVVWEDWRNNFFDSTLYGYDLSKKQEFWITSNNCFMGRYTIYKDIVVWEYCGNEYSDIYGYELSIFDSIGSPLFISIFISLTMIFVFFTMVAIFILVPPILEKKLEKYFTLEIAMLVLSIPLILYSVLSFMSEPENFIIIFSKKYLTGMLILILIYLGYFFYSKAKLTKRMDEKKFQRYKKRERYIMKQLMVIFLPITLTIFLLAIYIISRYPMELSSISKDQISLFTRILSRFYAFSLIILLIPPSFIEFRLFFKTKNYIFVLFPILLLAIVTTYVTLFIAYNRSLNSLAMAISAILIGIFLIKRYPNLKKSLVYRNLITDISDGIDSMMNAYSEIPFTRKSEILQKIFKEKSFEKVAREYGKIMANSYIIIDFDVKNSTAIYYLNTFNIVNYLFYAIFRKNKLSHITLDDEGLIDIFISKTDYESLVEPVTYGTLCKRLVEIFEKSFIKFSKGEIDDSVKILT